MRLIVMNYIPHSHDWNNESFLSLPYPISLHRDNKRWQSMSKNVIRPLTAAVLKSAGWMTKYGEAYKMHTYLHIDEKGTVRNLFSFSMDWASIICNNHILSLGSQHMSNTIDINKTTGGISRIPAVLQWGGTTLYPCLTGSFFFHCG